MAPEQKTSRTSAAPGAAPAGAPASPLGGWTPPGAATPEPEPIKLPQFTGDQQLFFMKHAAIPYYLGQVHGIPVVDSAGSKRFVDQFLVDAGRPKDPVEQMILEQIAMVHFRLGRLHVEAANAKTMEQAKIYNAAAARLTAEFRRLALTLRQYRQPVATTRSFAVVHQQNIATVPGGQEVTYVDKSMGEEKDALMMSRSRLSGMDTNEGNNDEHDAKPAARGGRSNHRPVAAAVD